MLYLVDEMYKQRGASLTLTIGEPIAPEKLTTMAPNRKDIAAKIRAQVYQLAQQ